METGKYINSNRSKKIRSAFKGERTQNESTIKSELKSNEELIFKFPSEDKLLLVPESLFLSFELCITGDEDAYPLNNLASNILKEVAINIGSTRIYHLENANLFLVYKDLWLSSEKRKNSALRGIQDEELSKMRSVKSYKPENPKKSHLALKKLYGNRYIIPLNFDVFADHIPLPTKELKENNEISIKLLFNEPKLVLKTTKPSEVKYSLINIKLHFENIRHEQLYNDIVSKINYGFSFYYEHISHASKSEIEKARTLLDPSFTIERNSLKGILFIFQNEERDDSEFFLDPEITSVEISISGISKKIYAANFQKIHHWDEIRRYFIHEDNKENHDTYMNVEKYYSENKYALWIDLRTTEDNNLFGSGKKLEKDEVKFYINRENTGSGKFFLYSYLVSDARLHIVNKTFNQHELFTKSD